MTGLIVTLLGVASYLLLLFVIHNFTYRTWLFDGVVGVGAVLAVAGWLAGGSGAVAVSAVAAGAAWLAVTRRELAIRGPQQLKLRPGDVLPQFQLLTTRNVVVTDDDLVADAPALLVLYRGWWCPSHKPQLDGMVKAHAQLAESNVSVYAASVDGPEECRPVQNRVGDQITVLCGVPDSLLDAIGVKDERGAPWYDRLIFGAKEQAIAMPAVILIGADGTVVHAARSTRVDQNPAHGQFLSKLSEG